MIRKYLVCGKRQIYLQSKNMDAYAEIGRVVELLMPVRDFWDLEKLVKDVNYYFAVGEAPAEVASSYKRVMRNSARFAVHEVDRGWLNGQKPK